jgi:O-antigen/teichoic acid export membrane protein
MAYNLGNLVAVQVAGPMGAVLFPAYTKMLPDLDRARAANLRLLRWASFLIVPFTAFGIIGAPQLVPLVLGPRWIPLTAALQVLLVYGCFHTLGPIHWALLQAGDHNGTNLAVNGASLTLAIAAAWPAAAIFGFLGVAVVFSGVEVLRFGLLSWSVRRYFALGIGTQLRAALDGVLGMAVAVAALLILRALWPPNHLLIVTMELFLAVVAYGAFQVGRGAVPIRSLVRSISLREAVKA